MVLVFYENPFLMTHMRRSPKKRCCAYNPVHQKEKKTTLLLKESFFFSKVIALKVV